MPGPWSRTVTTSSPSRAIVHENRRPGGGIARRSRARGDSAAAVSRGSSRTRHPPCIVRDVQSMAGERVRHLLPRRGDELRRIDPSRGAGDGAGVDARHLENVLEQARQPLDLGEHQIALLAPLVLAQPRRLQIARGDADRGQRRPQVVAERGEERRLQLLALARELRRLPLLEKLRALDRDRRDAGERIEGPRLDARTARGEQPDRLGAESQRNEANRPGRQSTVVPNTCGPWASNSSACAPRSAKARSRCCRSSDQRASPRR